ncbi:AcvB/VirJ family lysyl-phosphatidylglycerol hydrolase [Phaeovulum vinaykumarii]|uniref:Type IV secretory pathway, VirJ component n=1 Tax=Phaeovulum vinaykumarii TaxID=407234 RepID=A0A1N7L9F5_9RHOB|nr:AcvB/VirJ family lysyl-phosphatidylglycerol hydrolase [Phaeovulum vinaykumarii]SIS70466.1 Type IV secretory pathway, VirJ component [Phaeovulum vinaykumarii]SOB98889.1 type IV secretory pathway VirJ component [Phaeovulum vinaykumarii]
MRHVLSVLFCLLAPLAAWAAPQVGLPEGGRAPRSIALILSDRAALPDARALIARLHKVEAMTILLSAEDLAGQGCDGIGEAVRAVAHDSAAAKGVPAFLPVLVGLGAGADLALAAAGSQPQAFKGLATLDHAALPAGGCWQPRAGAKAPVRWHAAAAAQPFPGVAGIRHYPTDKGRTGALLGAYLALAGTDHALPPGPSALPGFPLTLHHDPAAPARDTYAIFLSGDGGWANFDREVADRLAAAGVPVAGLSTLKYLWSARTPADIAADMARIDAHFAPRFGRRRVLLVGFSMGANVTPFYARHLPPEMQARLAGLALLSPERRTGFEVVLGGWLGRATGAQDVAAAIDAAAPMRVACLYGARDDTSACPDITAPVALHRFEGGHHLDKDYDGVARHLLALIDSAQAE